MMLQKYREQLPTEVVALRDYILLSREKLKAYRVALSACHRLERVQEIRDQTLEEGQQIAEEILYAEARFGELLDLSLREDKA